jgi:hypothetical protein
MLVVGTPSFLDEIVKQVLAVRRADRLIVRHALPRVLPRRIHPPHAHR